MLIVSVEDPPVVTDDGLKDAVAPLGRPVADNATDCVLPEVSAVLIVVDAPAPAATESDVGLALIEKSLAVAMRCAQPLLWLLHSCCIQYRPVWICWL